MWSIPILKGVLDKYNIYLFISNSIEDFKSNQYRNFQLILPMRFHFMRYFVNSIIYKVSHRLLYCVFIEVDFENIESARNIHISSKRSHSRMWNSACSHYPCQRSWWYKNPNFFLKKLGDDVELVQCPFKSERSIAGYVAIGGILTHLVIREISAVQVWLPCQ